jgi:anaerobic selenocysteine-containing dehydrogenase
MVSVDIYLNETTKHADVILPPPSVLTRSHYDIVLLQFAVRAIARYTRPVLSPPDGQPAEWQILAMLAAIIQGDDYPSLEEVDDEQLASLIARETRNPGSPISGRDPAEIMDALSTSGRIGPDRVLEFMLRSGRYGDGFGADPGGLTLDRLAENPNGLDLGALEPALPGYLRTPSGKIELAHPILMADIDRLRADITTADDRLVLIGRRGLRSNNSWMHNIPSLTRGRSACTMLINPVDADRLGIESETPVACSRGEQSIVVAAKVTDDIVPGVVSIPHGWGHGQPGTRLTSASQRPGVNVNRLTDSASMDPLASTSVLNGVPVTVAPVRQD